MFLRNIMNFISNVPKNCCNFYFCRLWNLPPAPTGPGPIWPLPKSGYRYRLFLFWLMTTLFFCNILHICCCSCMPLHLKTTFTFNKHYCIVLYNYYNIMFFDLKQFDSPNSLGPHWFGLKRFYRRSLKAMLSNNKQHFF